MRRASLLGTGTTLADGSASMLTRVLLAMVVGCMAVLIDCTNNHTTTDVAPEFQQQQLAAGVEREQSTEHREHRDATPTSATNAKSVQATQSSETPASTQPEDSEASAQPETRYADQTASHSAASNPPAATSEQEANRDPSSAQSKPEASVSQAQSQQAVAEPEVQSEPQPEQEASASQAQSQEAVAEPEAQSEPQPEPEAPATDHEPEVAAEESYVAQPPATDPEEQQASQTETGPGVSGGSARQVGDEDEGEPSGVGDTDPPRTKKPAPTTNVSPSNRTTYTWQDGDATRTIWTDTETQPNERENDAGGNVSGADSSALVFYAESGQQMTLPGGVLLVFDAEWDQARIDRFFAENIVSLSLVQKRTFATNAFFIETTPGFASLNLANQLAGQDGVLISSPNWQTQAVTR